MHSEYPENINDIESFYQSSLAEVQIEPPAEMWDRINAALEKNKKPKGFLFFPFKFSTNIIILLLGSLTIATAAWLVYSDDNSYNKPSPNKKTIAPAIIKDTLSAPLNNSQEKTHNKKTESLTSENPSINEKKIKEGKGSNTTSSQEDIIDNINLQKESVPDLKSEISKTSPDTINIKEETSAAKEEIKTEKKKVSFKEKYKKQLKDSTRELFVPQK